jgi:hypothetical protein
MMNIFTVNVYIQHWYTCQCAQYAPLNDLRLIKRLETFEEKCKNLTKSTLEVLSRHLWYLSESLAGLAFFDERIMPPEKAKMVEALNNPCGPDWDKPRKPAKASTMGDLSNSSISMLITSHSKTLFETLGIPTGFLTKNVEDWPEDEDFQKGKRIIEHLKVVNDAAERGVALIQEFNSTITIHEEQKQYLLQVVELHRKQHPTAAKSSL